MKKYTLNYQCLIEASAQAVCQFHTDTNNLPLITPHSTHVKIIAMDVPLHEGSMVVLDIKRFGISTRWEMKIATLSCPHNLIDEMVKGPFSFFKHERQFLKISEHVTQMKETITFSPPIAWFGGFIFWLLKKDMDAMFAYRHQATQAYFLNKGLV